MSAIWSGALAQDGTRIHRHKLYDAKYDLEDKQKIKRRRFIVDVDSTGIAVHGWDDCFVKIKLRAKTDNLTFYKEGMTNGYPSVQFGNDNFIYHTYVPTSGGVEFDLILLKKPADGKNYFDFDVETKGVRLNYQPPLTQEQIDRGVIRPDSVVGSYSICRLSGANNHINLTTGEEVYYGTGKFGHIYRPKAWGANGDTVWVTMQFNPDRTKMRLIVDSTWLANAVLPVVIDPFIGNTVSGGSAEGQIDYEHNIQRQFTSTPGEGTITSATTFVYLTQVQGTNEWVIHAYTDPDAGTCASMVHLSTSSTATVTSTDTQNEQQVSMSGSFAAATPYVVVWQGNDSNNRMRYRFDAAGFGDECELADTDFSAPATLTGCGCASSQDMSVYITYTVAGGADRPSRRRKIIQKMLGAYNAEESFMADSYLAMPLSCQ